jgi:[NiFe] hydrogenase diaphorase moiety large subunit
MSKQLKEFVAATCKACGNDRARMMDVVRAVQRRFGCVSSKALDLIAAQLGVHRVEVESVVSFYAFLSTRPKGATVIRVCDDVVDVLQGAERVAAAFAAELGIAIGGTTADGAFTLEMAPCIGMSDQAPAALVDDVVITRLNESTARDIVRKLKAGAKPRDLVTTCGDGNNAHELVRAMVVNNIRRKGAVVFADFTSGAALRKAVAMSPAEVIRDIKTSRLRGRGGAGFPTGMKWDFTRQADGPERYVLCNADEGEPGTFKDRAILTESADLAIEGMTIGGYAVGSRTGILYLRAEYAYLQPWLEKVLADRRKAGLLGKNVAGKAGFDFDIRIQMGAGAYICGEETAMISSCEGLRGDPKNRPPYPAQKGYAGCPTTVNNVETFCCVARILNEGPGWFAQMGSKGSPGTKVLSVSGDCRTPGVYEVPFGCPIRDLLKMVGAENAGAVQIGGPSGQMIGPADFDRTICYDDLATGGAVTVFGPQRNVVEIARMYMEFFVEESCGYCTPCRVGNVLLKSRLDALLAGRGEAADLAYMEALGATMKVMSRCGLGQTSANPVLSTLKRFRPAYEALLTSKPEAGFMAGFDIRGALGDARELIGRDSVVFKG